MAKPDSLEETDAAHIAPVRNAKNPLYERAIEKKLQRRAHCGGRYSAPLSIGRKSETDLSGQPVGRYENADVANEMPVLGIGDTKLHPFTGRKESCFTHLAEKRQSFGLGHG